MASFDTIGSARGHADYVIASEEVIPGLGLDYGAWEVLTRPGVDPATIFDVVATTYQAEVAAAMPGSEQDFTLSMFDVNQADAIEAAIRQFATAAVGRRGRQSHPLRAGGDGGAPLRRVG